MEYSQKVMDHFMNPRNVGEIDNPSGVGTVGNAKCGDIMKVYLQIENGIIQDAKFKTFGCGAAIATAGIGGDQSSSDGSIGWIAASEGALFLSGRRSATCSIVGLCGEKPYCYRRFEKTGAGYRRIASSGRLRKRQKKTVPGSGTVF